MEINKKILASVFIIGLLAFGLGYGTYSFFSDIETSEGNLFTAGTLDIEVTGDGYTWSEGAKLVDMKPCETAYITFVIHNVEGNPVFVWKHIKNVQCDHGVETPPEIKESGGEGVRCWLPPWILYDLSVKVYEKGEVDPIWWQVIIPEGAPITVDDVRCCPIPLGMIPAGWRMVVTQSYHLKAEVTNWAQGDIMTFDITVGAEQLGSDYMPGVLLVPKKQAGLTGETGEWIIDWMKIFGTGDPDIPETWDGPHGYLTYNTKGPTFDYEFDGTAPLKGKDYDLIYYPDPWPGTGLIVIDSGHSDSGTGDISFAGSIDLGTDLPIAADANYPGGAKIWLVLSNDNDGTKMTAWNPDNYLFEFSLIKYDDTDV